MESLLSRRCLSITAAVSLGIAITGPVLAQERLGTAEALYLTNEQVVDIKARSPTFGFLTNNISDDFSLTLVAGAEAHAAGVGVTLVVNNADFNANTQLSQFDALVQQGLAGIFLTAVDSASIGQAVIRANDAGIPVFIVGGKPARGEVVAVMNASSYRGSFDAGAAMMAAIGAPNAQVAILGIPFALQTIRDREKGILDAVGAAGGQLISMQSDFSQDKLLELATNVIQANPDLGAIFAT